MEPESFADLSLLFLDSTRESGAMFHPVTPPSYRPDSRWVRHTRVSFSGQTDAVLQATTRVHRKPGLAPLHTARALRRTRHADCTQESDGLTAPPSSTRCEQLHQTREFSHLADSGGGAPHPLTLKTSNPTCAPTNILHCKVPFLLWSFSEGSPTQDWRDGRDLKISNGGPHGHAEILTERTNFARTQGLAGSKPDNQSEAAEISF